MKGTGTIDTTKFVKIFIPHWNDQMNIIGRIQSNYVLTWELKEKSFLVVEDRCTWGQIEYCFPSIRSLYKGYIQFLEQLYRDIPHGQKTKSLKGKKLRAEIKKLENIRTMLPDIQFNFRMTSDFSQCWDRFSAEDMLDRLGVLYNGY